METHRRHDARDAVTLLAALLLLLPVASLADDSESETATGGFGVVQDLGPPAGEPKSGEELDDATHDLASRLRCPVCQGLSVADSTSVSALSMREEIHEMFAKGYTEDQIVAYFESSFGEFVRLVPTARGFNLLVWFLPVIGLLTGLAIVLRQTRDRTATASSAGTEVEASPEDDELSDYRARVLREVDGGSAE